MALLTQRLGLFLRSATLKLTQQPTKSEKLFSYIKVCLPTITGLVQQLIRIVARSALTI